MAKIEYCGKDNNAKMYRLPSTISVYYYQLVFVIKKCRTCSEKHMAWKGEYPSGKVTQLIDIPLDSFDMWQRHIDAGEAKPEAQLMSEWAERAARPADIAVYYHNTLESARKWYKGQRV